MTQMALLNVPQNNVTSMSQVHLEDMDMHNSWKDDFSNRSREEYYEIQERVRIYPQDSPVVKDLKRRVTIREESNKKRDRAMSLADFREPQVSHMYFLCSPLASPTLVYQQKALKYIPMSVSHLM